MSVFGWNVVREPQPPVGAVSPPTVVYVCVGSGSPDGGGQIGMDVSWFDADGNLVGQSLSGLTGDEIDQAEYDALLENWGIR